MSASIENSATGTLSVADIQTLGNCVGFSDKFPSSTVIQTQAVVLTFRLARNIAGTLEGRDGSLVNIVARLFAGLCGTRFSLGYLMRVSDGDERQSFGGDTTIQSLLYVEETRQHSLQTKSFL